jgi:hypothetical protein
LDGGAWDNFGLLFEISLVFGAFFEGDTVSSLHFFNYIEGFAGV